MRATLAVFLTMCFLGAAPTYAQRDEPGMRRPVGPAIRSSVVTFTPLGVLQFGPNIEFERSITPSVSVAVGFRMPHLGLVAQMMDDDGGLTSSWMLGGILHFSPTATGLSGWFLGPRVEVGKTGSQNYTEDVWVGAFDFGYRWVMASGFSINGGGLMGTFGDTWTNRNPLKKSDTGKEQTFFAMAVLGLGMAF